MWFIRITTLLPEFLSTPSGWRATSESPPFRKCNRISIHALRVEGDHVAPFPGRRIEIFLSTPSGWRATSINLDALVPKLISIHALRVEGDDL